MRRLELDREILTEANQRGSAAQIRAWLRLSGPGWLQSAITLGGSSLVGALYLGVLSGTSMLWLQLVAIVIGVVMLSAISYVTLSTGIRPYRAINQYVNPVLGVGWITATILANMIFILPQFALCFDTLENNLFPGAIDGNSTMSRALISGAMAGIALVVVFLSFSGGRASRWFDWILKIMVGLIVVCFAAMVVWLTRQSQLDWSRIWQGFIPRFSSWNETAPDIAGLLSGLDEPVRAFWEGKIVSRQQAVMISATTTAVGINMTFLLPYSMIARGWDRPFRGLARFDLITAMAIPFILVTSCIVIASAYAFHGRADEAMLSDDPAIVMQSRMFQGSVDELEQRRQLTAGEPELAVRPGDAREDDPGQPDDRLGQLATFVTQLSPQERKLAATLVKPDTRQLAETLAPLFGNRRTASLVFGLGALAMGFSTIIILMLINGYAVAEMTGRYDQRGWRLAGAVVAGLMGFAWVWIWPGQSRTWLIMAASAFAAILLPIAYLAFFLMMNNPRLLGDDLPRGRRRWVWNILMAIGVAGAFAQAIAATLSHVAKPVTGSFVLGGVATFLLLVVVGFSARSRAPAGVHETDN